MSRFAIRRTNPLIALVLVAFASCQDATAPRTAPEDLARASLQPFGFSLAFISAGEGGACGVTAGGQAYCWGNNPWGALGNGTFTPSGVPVLVSGGVTFTTVSGSEFNTCGVAKGGQAYCWGAGLFGGLGNGSFDNSTVPVPVAGEITFASLSTARFGLGFTCGVAKGGQGYCWGIDGEGELGNGSSTLGVNFETPVPISGGVTFSSIAAGAFHACGRAKGGELYCWGDNSSGQLGLGFTSAFGSGSNVPVRVSTALVFVQISAGAFYTCGVTRAGAGYCWGANGAGQLGDGSITSRTAPVAITGGLSFASVSAGTTSTCGITKQGAAYCWGSNSFGQLGIGSAGTDPVTSPVPVSGGFTFTSISVGDGFACGVASKLGTFCWGDNEFGKLGSGLNVASTAAPTPVAAP